VNRKLAKILPIRALKLGPYQHAAEVERLKTAGKLPSLEELLNVNGEVRSEFRSRILAARKGRK